MHIPIPGTCDVSLFGKNIYLVLVIKDLDEIILNYVVDPKFNGQVLLKENHRGDKGGQVKPARR